MTEMLGFSEYSDIMSHRAFMANSGHATLKMPREKVQACTCCSTFQPAIKPISPLIVVQKITVFHR